MEHPYTEFEGSALWESVDQALSDLESNRDIALKTARTHAVGYLCRELTRANVAVQSTGSAVPVVFTQDDALVLHDFLAQRRESQPLAEESSAECEVLSRLEASFERQLVVPFDSDYQKQLTAARTRIINGK